MTAPFPCGEIDWRAPCTAGRSTYTGWAPFLYRRRRWGGAASWPQPL